MQTIIVRLDPHKLENADLDLRYLIPDRLKELSNDLIKDNGYDYLENDALGIWLKTESAMDWYPKIIELFKNESLLENDLSLSAEIFISENDAEDIINCRKVFPL